MKKLMIAAAIVCAAAMSQAATYYWNWNVTGAGTTGFEDSPVLVANTTAYLFAGYTTEDAMFDAADAMLLNLRGGNEMAGFKDYATLNAEGLMDAAQQISESSNFENWMYGVVIAEGKDGSKWAGISDVYPPKTGAEVGGPTMAVDLSYANDGIYGIDVMASDNTYVAGWYKIADGATPTPEPTSGLLLLLGVAGLALRRKQK